MRGKDHLMKGTPTVTAAQRRPSQFQRNALAPGLLAAAVLFLAPLVMDSGWFQTVQYAVTILALIVAWFALQARQWWWLLVFIPFAVLWNPIYPFPFTGPFWIAGQLAAALVFLVAGAVIKVRRR